MAERIELIDDETDTRAIAPPHGVDAPDTCAAIRAPREVSAQTDFAIRSGRGSRVLISNGRAPGHPGATLTHGLADLARSCARVHTEGVQPFIVRRYPHDTSPGSGS